MKNRLNFDVVPLQWLTVTFLAFIISSGMVHAQDAVTSSDTSRTNAVRVFIDCRSCDMNYMREEMPYVNFVRDVRQAQVYLQVTNQSTGSGGQMYTMYYTGQENFSGMRDTVSFTSNTDDTRDVVRTGLTNTIAAGIMRYVAKTPIVRNVVVRYEGGDRQEDPEQVEDKWDFWVFEIETEPDLSLEKSEKQFRWGNRVSVDRVTEAWKLQNSFSHNYNLNVFIREEEDSVGNIYEERTEAVRKSWSLNNLTVKSITGHWSVGMWVRASSSTYSNLDFKFSLSPAIEYNIFPYAESNQRELLVRYSLGFVYNNYVDSTVYLKLEDRVFEQSLNINLEIEQRWGSIDIFLGASNYLHDFSKNSFEIGGNLRIRLLKGLSLNVNGGVEFIHNQIELAKGGRSYEDLYLRLRELQTNYRYDAGIGLSYTFGSMYNNVVNPRFGGGGGGGGDYRR